MGRYIYSDCFINIYLLSLHFVIIEHIGKSKALSVYLITNWVWKCFTLTLRIHWTLHGVQHWTLQCVPYTVSLYTRDRWRWFAHVFKASIEYCVYQSCKVIRGSQRRSLRPNYLLYCWCGSPSNFLLYLIISYFPFCYVFPASVAVVLLEISHVIYVSLS